MSKSVAYFVIIRDGQKQCFEDRWASPCRELVWGADDLEQWLVQGDETDYDPEDLSGGAVVNFDSRELVWFEREALEIPRVMAVHQRLMEQAWPGFQIRCTSEREFYSVINESADDEDDEDWHDRCETVREAAGLYGDDEEPDEDEEEDDDDYEMTGAWVTVLDTKGKARHRNIEQISEDLVTASKKAIEHLAKLKAAEVPPEKAVAEGMWLDVNAREIGFWGGAAARRDFQRLQQSWNKWNVRWAENGYTEQCQVSGLPGVLMSDAEAAGTFVPQLLSTERFDLGNIVGAMGGQLKAKARKAAGCLLVLLSIPILIIGVLFSNMQAAGIAIGVLVAVVVVAFKVIEYWLKSKFRDGPLNSDNDSDERPPTSGPLDESERRERLDQMLSTGGFPSVTELEPHFSDEPSLDDIL